MAGIRKKNGGTKGVGLSREELTTQLGEMAARHVVQLSEHFSSIQIIATNLNPDGTTQRFAYGKGDLYARTKAAQCWLCDVHQTVEL